MLPDHPVAAAPAQPVYVSWRKLFAFLRWSNKQPVSLEVGGHGRSVFALFSSQGADKELFDRVEGKRERFGSANLIYTEMVWPLQGAVIT